MFVELLEALRCPRSHDESALVVAAGRMVDRHILDGTLGCPVCGAEFRISNGITQFEIPARPTAEESADPAVGLRLAAFLELTDAKGFAILSGVWGAQLDPVQRVSDTPCVLMNPPARYGGEPAAVILCDALPLAALSARAAALDADMTPTQITSVVRAVRTGGRIVGPSSLPLPAGVSEVARDDTLWVGEKPGAVRFVALRKAEK